ncbi:MAG: type II toxin-antitoxin system YafQ family toxin [Rhodospirillales bacterium]|nr:type II toxin-antitoxin system YafQ family toxin [Rhodospirillales bacterium]
MRSTGRFERDLKRAGKRGKRLDKLWAVVERLLKGDRLDARHRVHRLSGAWAPFLECHVEPDWLLIWHDDGDHLTLIRTGPHADLFD